MPGSIGSFIKKSQDEVPEVLSEFEAALQLDLLKFNSLGQHPYLARRFHLTAYMCFYIFILTENFEQNNDFHFEVSKEQRDDMVNVWKQNRERCDLVFVAIAAHVLNISWKFKSSRKVLRSLVID